MKLNTISTLTCASVLLIATHTLAAQTPDIAEAEKIVEEYKELRADCAKTEGDARKFCFAKLNDANEEYVEAKQYLREYSPEHMEEKDKAAHHVTFL